MVTAAASVTEGGGEPRAGCLPWCVGGTRSEPAVPPQTQPPHPTPRQCGRGAEGLLSGSHSWAVRPRFQGLPNSDLSLAHTLMCHQSSILPSPTRSPLLSSVAKPRGSHTQPSPSLLGCVLLRFQPGLLFSSLATAVPTHPIEQMHVKPQAEQGRHYPSRGAPRGPQTSSLIAGCESLPTYNSWNTSPGLHMDFVLTVSSPGRVQLRLPEPTSAPAAFLKIMAFLCPSWF